MTLSGINACAHPSGQHSVCVLPLAMITSQNPSVSSLELLRSRGRPEDLPPSPTPPPHEGLAGTWERLLPSAKTFIISWELRFGIQRLVNKSWCLK